MKHVRLFKYCAAFLCCTACSALLADPKLVKKVEPSVVVIQTDLGLGSGFIVAKDRVVTNYHVIKGARIVEVKFAGKGKPTFRSDGYYLIDEKRDIAVISLKLTPGAQTDYMKQVELAGALPLKGSKVMAMGNPKGLEFSVSEGIVAATREAGNIDIKFLRDRAGTWIQHDAPISSGNSGGPLFDSTGKVVGMNTSMLAGEGIQNLNFAISSLDIRRVVDASAKVALPLRYLRNPPIPVKQLSETSKKLMYAKFKELIRYHLNANPGCLFINKDGELQARVEDYGLRNKQLRTTIAIKPSRWILRVHYLPYRRTGYGAPFVVPRYFSNSPGRPPASNPFYSLGKPDDYWFLFSEAHSIRRGKILALDQLETKAHLSDGILFQYGRVHVAIRIPDEEFRAEWKATFPIGTKARFVCLIGGGVVYELAEKKINAFEIIPIHWFVSGKKAAELFEEVKTEVSVAADEKANERLMKNAKANIYHACKNKAGVTVDAYVTNVTETTITLVWQNPKGIKTKKSYLTGEIDKATFDQATLDWVKKKESAIRQLGPRIQKLLFGSE